ncbi:MAG: MFS transporter [Candidatus Rokubacteria bacterium]|nr:MFS transporter [Candidatus Rokubacteria bacterium]
MRSRWTMLGLATLAHGAGALTALAVAPLAPFLVDALALSRGEVGLCLPAVYLGGVLMALPAGWLTDRLGVRRALGLGQLALGALVCAAAASGGFAALLALLALAGFGFSVLNPATGKAIVEWFPPRERGLGMGIKQTGLTLGILSASLALPPIALAWGWRLALAVAGTVSLLAGILVLAAYRRPAHLAATPRTERPRLGELAQFLRRRDVLVVFGCGLLLSIVQSSVLAYLTLYAHDTFGVSAVAAARVLALAQVGGTGSRLAWGWISDHSFGGRRRPGIVVSAAIGAVASALFALGAALPLPLAVALALVAGAGAFGWVGLYFALVAEIGGPRHAGLLTGVATAFAWSGTLVGPPVFGLLLEASGGYAVSWLLLAVLATAVALTLPRLRPLVQRG